MKKTGRHKLKINDTILAAYALDPTKSEWADYEAVQA